MRQLKYHENKLLKKVNFLEWKNTNSSREHFIISKYNLTDREEYTKYNRLVGKIRKLTEMLSRLKDSDYTKKTISSKLVNRLYDLGLINTKKLKDCTKIKVSDFCERRLPMLMKKNKMMPNFTDASRFVEHGHVRLGHKVVSETSIIISRAMEDFINWVDSSKIKKKIDEYNEERDDY
ncbi:U3 small nucleolar ribonucleoprotein IMP3 [Vairimorpha necatrix]|uniref:U3 small nucleolar ribonucleoprotein IMP3 n=1 Tax=Vairimorpha necatrix TaxID=6039 RepID=A0AAX4JA24_9MICR